MENNPYLDALTEVAPAPSAAPNPNADSNPYAGAVDQMQNDQVGALKQSMFVGGQQDPDRAAKVLQLSNRFKVNSDYADRNFEELSKKDALVNTDYGQIVQKTPGLATWLQNPDNSGVGHDDLEPLGRMDQAVRMLTQNKPQDNNVGGAVLQFGKELGQATAQGSTSLSAGIWQLAAAYGLANPDTAANNVAVGNKVTANLQANAPDYVKHFNSILQQQGGDLQKSLDQFTGSFSEYSDQGILQALKDFGSGAISTAGDALSIIKSFAANPRATAYSLAQMAPLGIATLPGGAALGAAGAATGPLAPILTPVGFAAGTFANSVPLLVGGKINDLLEQKGFDTSNADDLRRAYSDPEIMKQIRTQAENYGVTMSAIQALFTPLAGKFAAVEGGLATKALGAAADIGVQATGQTVAEAGGQFAEKGSVNASQALQNGILTLAHSAGTEAIGHSLRSELAPETAQAAKDLTTKAEDAVQTTHDIQVMQELGQTVKDSKTAARVPDKIAELVNVSGGEGNKVFFQNGDWDKYWTDKNLSPAKAAEDIMGDGGKAYFESKETGTPLGIPMSDYVSKVGPTEHYEGLLGVTRTSPDGMTLSEADEYLKSVPATMEELAKEAQAPVQRNADQETHDIEETTRKQLIAAGRPASEAAQIAELNSRFYRTQALNEGKRPAELFQERGIVFNSPETRKFEQSPNVMGQKAFEDYMMGPQFKEDYRNRPGTFNGHLIDQDHFRMLHPQYAESKEGKVLHMSKTLDATRVGTQDYVDHVLTTEKPTTLHVVMGGNGAGKSTISDELLSKAPQDYVFNTIGQTYGRAAQTISSALKKGWKIDLRFVYRPLDQATEGVKARFFDSGREVPPYQVTSGHVNSNETFLNLVDKFLGKDGFTYEIINNANGLEGQTLPLDELKKLGYIQGNETAQETIQRLLPSVEEALKPVTDAATRTRENGKTFFQSGQGLPARSEGQGISENPNLVSPLGFYSKLHSDIRAMDFQSMPAKELANRLKNLPGIKAEELEWSGLQDYLNAKEGKVTKQEIEDFINENGVKVSQVVLGESAGTSKDIEWSAPEQSSLSEIDPYGDLVSEEMNYYLKESDVADEWKQEFTKELAPEFKNDEEGLAKAVQQKMEDRAEEYAKESLSSPDSPYAEFKIEDNNSDLTITGNDERGWYLHSRDFGVDEHVDGSEQEAKIQAIRLLQEKGHVPEEIRPTLKSDVQWENSKPIYKFPAKKIDEFYSANKKRFLDEQKKSFWEEDGRIDPASKKRWPVKKLEEFAKDAAKYKYLQRFDNIQDPKNFFKVETENPFFRLLLEGSAKKGFDLTVKDKDEISTSFKASTIEEAKAKALDYLKEKGLVLEGNEVSKESPNKATAAPKFQRYSLPGGTNYREILLTLPNNPEGFRGGHFSQDNVLAHIRTTDRVGANGEKVLYVDEIQSDWHQKGREQGYRSTNETELESLRSKSAKAADDAGTAIEILKTRLDGLNNLGFDSFSQALSAIRDHESNGNLDEFYKRMELNKEPLVKTGIEEFLRADKEDDAASDAYNKARQGIPNAPFKSSEAWGLLAMKRLLSVAAQDGYDELVWGPGEVHADRYNLSKHVGKIEYRSVGVTDAATGQKEANKYILDLSDPNGRHISSPQESYSEKELISLLGKDVASKIISGEGKKSQDFEGYNTLSTEDLKIGGEGHKYFYDTILPKLLQKHLSKLHEGLKVQLEDTSRVLRDPLESDNEYKKVWVAKLPIEARAKIEEGQTLFQGPTSGDQGPRGQIKIGPNQSINIDLFKSADVSTPIHELGHAYLDILGDLSSRDKASESLKADYKTIQDWLGVKEGEALTTDQHEQFARGFEAYVMEGKAPSSALRKAFTAFKVWLTNIYRNIKGLNVEISPEIRGVFDRMLATEDEISQAEVQQHQEPLFKDPIASGMNEPQAKKYIQARDEARDFSERQLQDKLMKDLTREQTAAYKAKEVAVKDQVTFEVENSTLYKALDRLQSDEPIDGATPIKLSKSEIPKEFKLPRGITSEDGLHPAVVADVLGFDSAEDMLKQFSEAPKKTDAIKAQTDAKMEELYPKLLDSPQISDEAMKAVHNEKRAQLLRMELEHLASNNLPALKEAIRKIARRVPTEKVVRESAERIIGGTSIQEVRPHLYELAERKASKEAGELLAKGDIDGAFEAKRKELLNHELYRSAVDAQADIEKSIDRFKKLARSNEDLSKSRDVNLVDAARSLLAQYGLGQSDKTPESFLKNMKSYDPDAYEAVTSLLEVVVDNPRNYQTLSYNDFVDLKNKVDALWSLSKSQKEITIEGQKIDRDTAIADMSKRISELQGPVEKKQYDRAKTTWEKTKMALLGMVSSLQRIEQWVDSMDSGNIKGPFRKYIASPAQEAVNRYRLANDEYLRKFVEILKPLRESITKEPIRAPELVNSRGEIKEFSGKSELLGALLHTGNMSNFDKLLRGQGWEKAGWDKFVERMQKEGKLTKSDYDAIQKMWDLFEETKPAAQIAHKQMYGYHFNEITAEPFKNQFGEYNGGYAPAIADPMAASDAQIRADKEAILEADNSFMFPTTGRGFTKGRVEAYAKPLIMDLRLISSQIDKIMRFVHLEPAIKDIGKIVMNRNFRQVLDAHDDSIAGDMIVPWLQRTARQRMTTPTQGKGGRGIDTFFKEIRSRTGLATLVGSAANLLHQYSGFSTAAVLVEPKKLLSASWDYMKAPKQVAADVAEKSDFMRARMGHQTFKLASQMDEILSAPTKFEKAVDFMKANGLFLQQMAQNHADMVAWPAAYNQGIEKGLSEKEAVTLADSVIRRTQHLFNPEDVSRFETGPAWVRTFTQFYGYFNMKANLNIGEFQKTARDLGLKKGAGRLLYVFATGMLIPALYHEAIVRGLAGKQSDNNDDEYLKEFMDIFFGGVIRDTASYIPIAGPAVQSIANKFVNDGWYDDRIASSPAISALESAGSAPHSIYKYVEGEGSGKKAIRDSLTALSLITGLPVAPLSRPLGYLSDVNEGKAEPTGPIDFARGLISGRSGK